MKLKTRIQLLTTGLLVVLLLAAHVGIYVASNHLLVKTVTDRLDDQSEDILQALQKSDGDESIAQLIKASTPTNGMVRVISDGDTILSIGTRVPELRELEPSYAGKYQTAVRDTSVGRAASVFFPLIWSDGQVVTLEITESLAQEEKTLTVLRGVLLVSALFILLPVVFGARLLAGLITKPIGTLITTMDDIERSGSFQTISKKRRTNDELSLLTQTFNRMINRLEGNFSRQQQFVSDASHELKTPLTVINSYASVLSRWGKSDPAVRDEAIEAIQSETNRMQHLVKQLLDLAREDQQGELNLEQHNIIHLSRQTVQRMKQITNNEMTVSGPELTVFIDAEKYQQLLFILLDNAIKYGDDPISVSITKDEQAFILTVADHGPGIDPAEWDRVFDRFFRVDKARSRNKGGTGLGLALAYQIVKAHGGTIQVQGNEPQGTKFIVCLPLEVIERR
ncbi:Signal transduction histidine-protein kinase ArlS [Paraliobacillus sp. PM-2]|uniref:sensor histidine kinase n=1 Tax=Paraliobacillus sp. PM-2 TaxID=1462524 RepID=UPI00061C931F|nr:HAMP domain-containing sensor histidine kinase [Paraliobacillus sp. PM-2]CQR45900.1 Signal transduction histidine-protein kinase ArlS [Paraliobacillus sp. PM-2]